MGGYKQSGGGSETRAGHLRYGGRFAVKVDRAVNLRRFKAAKPRPIAKWESRFIWDFKKDGPCQTCSADLKTAGLPENGKAGAADSATDGANIAGHPRRALIVAGGVPVPAQGASSLNTPARNLPRLPVDRTQYIFPYVHAEPDQHLQACSNREEKRWDSAKRQNVKTSGREYCANHGRGVKARKGVNRSSRRPTTGHWAGPAGVTLPPGRIGEGGRGGK